MTIPVYLFLSLLSLFLVSYSMNHCQVQYHEAFPLCFVKDFHRFRSYVFDSFWITFCDGGGKVQLNSFVDIQFFQHHLLYCTAFAPLSKSSWLYLQGSTSGLSILASPRIYLPTLSLTRHFHNHCSFTVKAPQVAQ